jgi:hypothetical protein
MSIPSPVVDKLSFMINHSFGLAAAGRNCGELRRRVKGRLLGDMGAPFAKGPVMKSVMGVIWDMLRADQRCSQSFMKAATVSIQLDEVVSGLEGRR